MSSFSKLLGGMLLIVGTSIGGGMLALPVITASAGFLSSVIFLFFCWVVMTAGAFLILEVNLRLPVGSNMVTMAKSTLGIPGQIIAWTTYLFLLYTLLAAYISGGSDVFTHLLMKVHIAIPFNLAALIYTLLLAFIISKGIWLVDHVNRGLMFGKIGVYLLLVVTITPHINISFIQGGHAPAIVGSLMVLITSFGFATIVPSLREYFDNDIHSLRKVIVYGSLIPLICYIVWIAVIAGVIHREGDHGLLALIHSDHATSGLTEALSGAVNSKWITAFFDFFTSICMLTAFLGVSLGLYDFLADGLKLKKSGYQSHINLVFTFVPPLALVFFKPGAYLQALAYAGTCCVILLLLLPVVMAWRSRKTAGTEEGYVALAFMPGGNTVLILLGVVGIVLLFLM